MAQRYKNTPTIADAKTRKHAFQTIINDYRSLSDYSEALFYGICSVFCFLCLHKLTITCQQECFPAIKTSIMLGNDWAELLLRMTKDLVDTRQSFFHTFMVLYVRPHRRWILGISPTWCRYVHETIAYKVEKNGFIFHLVIKGHADCISIIFGDSKDIKRYEENTKGVIKIRLHIVTSYSDKAPDNQLFLQFQDSIPMIFERMQKDLCKRKTSLKPSLMICWKIPKSIVFYCEHTYPGLWAFAKIYPVIKHKGAIG